MRLGQLGVIAGLGLAVSLLLSACLPLWPGGPLSENFSSVPSKTYRDGAVLGSLQVRSTGYGKVAVVPGVKKALLLRPKAPTKRGETHAALVVSRGDYGACAHAASTTMSFSTTTRRQLRAGGGAPWEVSWAVWGFSDEAHFYYAIVKTNGLEIGKRDPSYPGGQRFLYTSSSPRLVLNKATEVVVVQENPGGNRAVISVAVNGVLVARVVDTERPLYVGKVGTYSEDAEVYVHKLTAATTCGPIVTTTTTTLAPETTTTLAPETTTTLPGEAPSTSAVSL